MWLSLAVCGLKKLRRAAVEPDLPPDGDGAGLGRDLVCSRSLRT
jgi:hypothetical protein